jgi:malate dehydrogenase
MGGLLDSLRYRSLIANEVGISREDVSGFVIGEHGDHMIPLTDFTSASGIPIKCLMKKDRIEKIVKKTKTGGMDVISRKGSTIYGPSSAIAFMVESILKGKNRIVSASVIPDGEYGLKDIAIGLPIILGKNGVEKIIELNFDEEIRKKLLNAASIIKSSISDVKGYF